MLDRTNNDEVMKFNALLEDYWALVAPERKSKKVKTLDEKAKLFEDFKYKLQAGKLKNFQEAK